MHNEDRAEAQVMLRWSDIDELGKSDQFIKVTAPNRNVWLFPTTEALDLHTVNGAVMCLHCDGQCDECGGDGAFFVDCRCCNGSGIYKKQRYQRKPKSVKCRRCKGTG
eukprot:CAMPEP_0197045200 /NCGR_PEP_ID=MMETSP1384-20130603/21113_1 /TAXON_ID=29189 /ORGANISM="Ammonia sp." /LENGTH=107 /DNA_ID=CAMNT_0042476775 /DNA_START=204 /DNA_END=524 /DNA_ORIENTATION=+